MDRYTKRRRSPRNSDAWRYPGMYGAPPAYYRQGRFRDQRDEFGNDRGYDDRHYDDPRGPHYGPVYREPRNGRYDADIYEREFVNDPYEDRFYRQGYHGEYPGDQMNYEADDRRHDLHSRGGFFRRTGERLREIFDDWRHPDRREGYFGETFREDREEHRYGRDNWAPNANRGYRGRRRREYKTYH